MGGAAKFSQTYLSPAFLTKEDKSSLIEYVISWTFS